MTSIVLQVTNLSLGPTFPSPNPAIIRPPGHLTLCQVLSGGKQKQISRIPLSAGMGRTAVGRVGRCMGLARCVLILLVVCQDHLTWVPVGWHSCWARRDRHPRASGSRPQVLNLIREARFIIWHMRRQFFSGMPIGPEVFLELLGVSRLKPSAWTHLKRPCATLIRLMGRTTNTDFFPSVEPDSFRTDTSTCCTNTLILFICSVYTIPPTFSSSVSFFWPLTGRNRLIDR